MDMIEQTDLDDVFSLQFVQWTVPQFCFRVLENVVRCLQGVVDEELSVQCFELIHQGASLLADSLIPAALWEDTSIPAHELVINCKSMLCLITADPLWEPTLSRPQNDLLCLERDIKLYSLTHCVFAHMSETVLRKFCRHLLQEICRVLQIARSSRFM